MSSCKIIGVGGAGCNLVAAICSAGQKINPAPATEYVYLDLGTLSMLPDQFICNVSELGSPITKTVLAPHGSGGRVNAARAAALRNIDALKAAVSGCNTAIVVAGLGGGTGSAVAPILARLARGAGVATIATVVMPFDFEGPRNGKAVTALSYLEREVDLVMPFSNQKVSDAMGGNALITEIYSVQDQMIAKMILRFITI